MSKHITISLPEWYFGMYIPSNLKNRSEYLSKLIVLGASSIDKNPAVLESEIFKMRESMLEQEKELTELRQSNAKLKDFNSEIRTKERAALREAKRRERLHLRSFVP